ncbi:prepilin-type N-terminal cleavage/methylation domain-containing protein [Puniceicoccus vermicola]|uniref:Prepilin-type N-terminal cleavage/methylation domain-containing protein n=1 Tax=Puniceicoccus vermicola TaxID=388746 RepID=A0A7X1E500_9BACT|nr:prepilin-type N-terminal cleavage/methylation domain-containing protein [Puniceicoccus vermicola]MBC2603110.1 prepilin-type N-terminal cleavage/methylation domain-containing protein [Puniceicoccus vermicola]
MQCPELVLRRNGRGFTLPEVLLALALLTVAAVAVGGAVRSSLNLLGRAREVRQPPIGWSVARDQVLLAESREELEEGDRMNLPNGDRVRWSANLDETEIPDLFMVELEIEAGDRESKERLFLFRPDWSVSVDRGPLMDDARREIQKRLDEVNR